ncbi:MAG TPA: C4-type zinc ribbon domain-containing protein [Longimicrobiales bacterium]|nr:C4-type zinc ribbon domain-containing protein [Longimicrobiales bacterium]
MQELHAALLALQEMDTEIARADARVQEFTPRIDTLDAPVTAVERELAAASSRLQDLRAEYIRLEQNAQQKEERLHAYQEKLAKARTSRDEAAVRAELSLIGSALEADRSDIRHVGEQTTRTDIKVDELQKQLDKARAEIAAEREQLVAERDAAQLELDQLRDKRQNAAVRLDPQSRRLYERLRVGRSRMVLAPLTDEGACGNCFNVLPVQEQTEVRRGESLRRCEGCGVILYAA